jgi:hypothetical protein
MELWGQLVRNQPTLFQQNQRSTAAGRLLFLAADRDFCDQVVDERRITFCAKWNSGTGERGQILGAQTRLLGAQGREDEHLDYVANILVVQGP